MRECDHQDRGERVRRRELLDPLDGLDQDETILPFATGVGKEKVAAPLFTAYRRGEDSASTTYRRPHVDAVSSPR